MKNKIILLVSFFTVVFSLVSCLKDNVGEYWKDDLAGKMYATVADPSLKQLALKPVAGDVKYDFLLNIATDALPTEDITVTLKIDPAAVTEYNKNTGKSFKPYPNIEILTKTVLIAKGTRNATASAKVWGAESLNACDNFIAAITIESASTASGKSITIGGNMKSSLTALPIANPYAGSYHLVGYRIHPTLGTLPADKTTSASTVDCKTIRKPEMGDYPYNADITITSETMTVNGATVNKVIVSSPDVAPANFGMYDTFTGDPASAPASPGSDVNYYDPATKTFVLNYFYLSGGVARKIYEIMTRL
jgi:hypothetical protein